jgi:hypothetical protein
MNNYCVALNLNLKIFNSDLHPVDVLKSIPSWSDQKYSKPSGNKHIRIPREIINQEFIKFFSNYNIHLIGVEAFYTVPNGKNIVHSDVLELGDVAKINWVYGGDNSMMHWYKPNALYHPDNITAIRTGNETRVGSPSLRFLATDVDLLYSETIHSPSIVQVGCPHNVTNGPIDRYCISAIFSKTGTLTRLTVAESREIFKEFVVPYP